MREHNTSSLSRCMQSSAVFSKTHQGCLLVLTSDVHCAISRGKMHVLEGHSVILGRAKVGDQAAFAPQMHGPRPAQGVHSCLVTPAFQSLSQKPSFIHHHKRIMHRGWTCRAVGWGDSLYSRLVGEERLDSRSNGVGMWRTSQNQPFATRPMKS